MTTFIVYQFVGGNAFFAGAVVAGAAVACRLRITARWTKATANVGAVFGAMLLALSGTPLPMWGYGVWGVVFTGALCDWKRPQYRRGAVVGFCFVTAAMVAWELPHQFPARIPTFGCDSLFVVGDSLSMGADPPGKNWPELLGDKAGLATKNYSFGGAKVDSSLSNAERIDRDRALVILEIGGNDLLSGSVGFETKLEQLLKAACTGQRRVVMLELPLPPFFNRFGVVQRRLAREYGVTLVPKRYLARVLATPGATVDGLHFSNKGHELLAGALFALFDTRRDSH